MKYSFGILWWRTRQKVPDSFAQCPNGSSGVRPDKVDPELFGHHASAVFVKGTRVYAFESKEMRDKFVEAYAHKGAQACEDPYP